MRPPPPLLHHQLASIPYRRALAITLLLAGVLTATWMLTAAPSGPAAEAPASTTPVAVAAPLASAVPGSGALVIAAAVPASYRPSGPAVTGTVGPDDKVMILPIHSGIERDLIYLVRRAFNAVRHDRSYRAVVIDMDTLGGGTKEMEEIIGLMRDCDRPVIVYVNTQAGSAGALICLASKHVYMAPAGVIGAAAPIMVGEDGKPAGLEGYVKEKMFAYMRGMCRTLAQENGYLPELAESFVDQDVPDIIIDGVLVHKSGKLLVLTSQEATRVFPSLGQPLLAKGSAATLDELLKSEHLDRAQRDTITPTGAEHLARFITMLAPLLMVGFLLGLYIESHASGFGVAGVVAIGCLALFLFGHYIAGLSGWLEVILIIVGIVLLALELFVIPGFGIAGFAGIACLVAGIIMAMIPHIPKVPTLPGQVPSIAWEPYVEHALLNLAIALVISGLGAYILSRYLPKSKFFNRLVLHSSATIAAGYVGTDVVSNRTLIGQTGTALTTLRPAGTADIGGQRVDVVTQGDFITKGDAIQVVQVDGPRVVVIRAPPAA